MKLAAFTLGCKVNAYDTEAMCNIFLKKGYEIVDFSEEADIYLINTCTVTNLGDKKSRQMIRRAKKTNPKSIVVVTGCYAQVSPEEIEKIIGVNLILGTKDRSQIVELVENYLHENENRTLSYVTNIMDERIFEPLSIDGMTNKTRGYLKIQEGCDRFCSYCIIPYARGPVRSRQEEDILEEVKTLSANGFKEIVLTGIHVASYGKDLKNTNLLEIIKKVHSIDGIERIRFSSIEPTIITEDFVHELSKMNKICSHIHLSLQSGCDNTLKNMNRKYTTKEYTLALNILRKFFPNIAVTTDIIVGFPDETESDFIESYNFCNNSNFAKIHVFPFSAKKGTKAFEMENQIPNEVKTQRAKDFNILNANLTKEFLNTNITKIENVLFETRLENNSLENNSFEDNPLGDNFYEGYSSNYILVKAKSNSDIRNKILPVSLDSLHENSIYGSILL